MEVTAALTVLSKDDIAKVQQALESYNKTGSVGSIAWIALYWGPEGECPGIP